MNFKHVVFKRGHSKRAPGTPGQKSGILHDRLEFVAPEFKMHLAGNAVVIEHPETGNKMAYPWVDVDHAAASDEQPVKGQAK